MQRFIAYYRVSTQRQGRSGLGLAAQQRKVSEFVASTGIRKPDAIPRLDYARAMIFNLGRA